MRIVFRVDSSSMIGSGHLMRCLALAHELARAGAEPHFVCAAHGGKLDALVGTWGFPCHELTGLEERMSMDHRLWTADAVAAHVAELRRAIASIGPVDWLAVDNYGLDARFESSCRAFVKHVAVIDDLANREHDATVLIDQNLYQDMNARYRGLVPDGCLALLGPAYALLREEFRTQREARLKRSTRSDPLRVLAFFGGGDGSNETEKFLLGWRDSGAGGLATDVVVGGGNARIEHLRSLAATMPSVRIHHQTSEMAMLMAASDYSFGASGSANWERLCLGLNASVVSVADNQVQTARSLAQEGLVDYIGRADDTSPSTYAEALLRLQQDAGAYVGQFERLMHYVDGAGARRVADVILNTAS